MNSSGKLSQQFQACRALRLCNDPGTVRKKFRDVILAGSYRASSENLLNLMRPSRQIVAVRMTPKWHHNVRDRSKYAHDVQNLSFIFPMVILRSLLTPSFFILSRVSRIRLLTSPPRAHWPTRAHITFVLFSHNPSPCRLVTP